MSHEYRAFDDFINEKGDFKNIPKDKLMKHGLTRIFHTLLCVVGVLIICQFISFDYIMTEEWATSWLPYRFCCIIGTVHIKAFVMFAGMAGMEANLIACG